MSQKICAIKMINGDNVSAILINDYPLEYEVMCPIVFFTDMYGQTMMRNWMPGLGDSSIKIRKAHVSAFTLDVTATVRHYYKTYMKEFLKEIFERRANTTVESLAIN